MALPDSNLPRHPARCRACGTIAAECQADLAEVSRHRAGRAAGRSASTRRGWRCAACARRFSLFRGAVDGPRGRARSSAEAKWLAGECAPARDLHVFLTETVTDVPPVVKRVAAGRLARSHCERARAALAARATTAFDRQLDRLRARPRPRLRRRRQPDSPRRLRSHRARDAPRQGRAARPACSSSLDDEAAARAAHRHQEAALCRDLPAARPLPRQRPSLYRGNGAPAGRARRLERSRDGGPDAGRHRHGRPSDART